jgi:hypothetical protein
MAVNLSPVAGAAAQFFDNSGNVLTGGKLYTYSAGTTTPAVTYTNSSGVTAHPNPIIFNAAGRVPDSGEIWLTDGISYKFVLKDQNDVLIATYDNLSGINSNFVNFTGEEETQTATQGQTVFTLTTIQYQPATNNLLVFVNGSKQIPIDNFIETSSAVVTFVDGLNVGDVVDFCTATPINTAIVNANAVVYNEGSTGAIDQSVEARLQQYVSIKDFGAIGDGVTDDTNAIQNALNSGAKTIDFLSLETLCDEIEIPTNVNVVNLNLKKKTASGNVVLVNTGCSVHGKITGTGTLSIVERGVYPAANDVTDVIFDVECIDLTYGIHAQPPVSGTAYADAPKRWSGNLKFTNIAGTTGASEGYGLLLSPGYNCQFDIVSNSPNARHIVYLSAGASYNQIQANINGCTNYAAQIYATSPQTACEFNTLNLSCKSLTETVSGQSGAIGIIGLANFNTVTFDVNGGNVISYAALIEGSATGPYPLSNKIINCAVYGQFTGADVIRMLNADSTIIANNSLNCYATASVIGMRRVGTNNSLNAGFIQNNTINGLGQNVKGIYNECNSQPSWIGSNLIQNNGTSLRVDDRSNGYRQGYSRRLVFNGTTSSIPSGQSLDVTVTLPDSVQINKRTGFINLIGASVQFFNVPFWATLLGSASESTQLIRIYNGGASTQTLDYSGVIEGD